MRAAELRTERLRLRPFRPGDAEALLAIHGRPEVTRYLYWEARDLDDVRRVLEIKCAEHAMDADGHTLDWAVELADTGELVADVSLFMTSVAHRQGEIGFIAHPDHHGRGYTTEACRPLLRAGFEDLGFHRLAGRLEARNAGSARVLEKLGLRREAHLVENEWVKGEWQSELVYALLAREWRERGAQERLQD